MNNCSSANRALSVSFLLGCLSLLQGCVMFGVTKISEPSVPNIQSAKFEEDILLYRDLAVSVKPQNYYVSFFSIGPIIPIVPFPTFGEPIKRKNENFVLRVQVETESEGYSFQPSRLALYRNGVELKPTDAWGPYPGGGQAREVERTIPGHKWECRHVKDQQITKGLESRAFKGKSCFEILFPITTPSPEEEFRITLDGFTKDGTPVPPFTLQFRPSSRSGFTLMAQ
jgi:hypothetical protein